MAFGQTTQNSTNPVLSFKTGFFHGLWLHTPGDREATRITIQLALQATLGDPAGRLVVRENGPFWEGSRSIHLSYSHTQDHTLVVYSAEREVGVDIEWAQRKLGTKPQELAKRFFHPDEVAGIHSTHDFLELWCKKEAYGKMTRGGLKESLPLFLQTPADDTRLMKLPVAPAGYLGYVAGRLN